MRLLETFQHLGASVSDDPLATLVHYVCGDMLDWAGPAGGELCWKRASHRGVQWLDKIAFPKREQRYIFSPRFEIRFDTAFEETLRGCAEQVRREPTWITEPYIRAMVGLYGMGYAHSFEAWSEGRLVGGAFGVQLGSIMTCDSMFHRVSNASKAAYGQTLVRLRERGFRLLDTNGVVSHRVKYGEEWMAQWRFEELVGECLREWPGLADSRVAPQGLPWEVRAALPVLRVGRAVGRRLGWDGAPVS
ncbi:MAG: aat [Phycisphaerales bacterium]|nr:aat [Phycisphaerales bacterium]